ncbi:CGNR zinc finger domain-containing protein [Actinosynnema sp. NPDC023587]|uniref:CGNR zinc finger domain-containing protein n=1 Tax=Actinosynnema sp. NPDC023587 TaxID=3154695 RepID=UPI003410A3C7
MHFNPYGGTAAQLAAALVNAAPSATPEDLVAVLRAQRYKPVGTLTAAEAGRLSAWARRLEPVFAGGIDRVAHLNALLAETAARPYISIHDDRPPHLHFAPETASTLVRVRAFTAAGLAHVVCEEPDRLGRCGREGCGTVYVDTSRNGRRRYCTTRCANRLQVARHRERHAS